jgi:hypothetical protein
MPGWRGCAGPGRPTGTRGRTALPRAELDSGGLPDGEGCGVRRAGVAGAGRSGVLCPRWTGRSGAAGRAGGRGGTSASALFARWRVAGAEPTTISCLSGGTSVRAPGLRQREFEAGRYNPVMHFPSRHMPPGPDRRRRGDSTTRSGKPGDADADGTRPSLTSSGCRTPLHGVASDCRSPWSLRHRPSGAGAGAGGNGFPRGHRARAAVYLVLYEGRGRRRFCSRVPYD